MNKFPAKDLVLLINRLGYQKSGLPLRYQPELAVIQAIENFHSQNCPSAIETIDLSLQVSALVSENERLSTALDSITVERDSLIRERDKQMPTASVNCLAPNTSVQLEPGLAKNEDEIHFND